MQNIVDIINDLEKENKLIDTRFKCNAFISEANNITRSLNILHNDNDNDLRFRLEYCNIADKNNNIYYYRFSLFSLDRIREFSKRLRDMSDIEKRGTSCLPNATFCIREADLSERENNILKVIAKSEKYYNENIDVFSYKIDHLKLFEYMEYMMALSLVKCLEKAELAKVEIVNLKNEIYEKKGDNNEKILG